MYASVIMWHTQGSYMKHNVITFVFFRVAVVLWMHYHSLPIGHLCSRVNFVCWWIAFGQFVVAERIIWFGPAFSPNNASYATTNVQLDCVLSIRGSVWCHYKMHCWLLRDPSGIDQQPDFHDAVRFSCMSVKMHCWGSISTHQLWGGEPKRDKRMSSIIILFGCMF